MMTAGRTEPGILARNKLSRALYPYSMDDVRYEPTLEEQIGRIDSVTLEQIKTLYETQVGGSHAELGLVGDFLRRQCEDRLFLLGQVAEVSAYIEIGHNLAGDGPVGRAADFLRLNECLLGVIDLLLRRAILQEALQLLGYRGRHLVDIGRVRADGHG